jgi:hypothetical protein
VLILEKNVKPFSDDFEMTTEVEKAESNNNPGLSDFEQIADGGSWDMRGDDSSDSVSRAGCEQFIKESVSSKRIPYVSMSTGSTSASSSAFSALQLQDRRINNQYSTMPREEASISSSFDTSSSSLHFHTVAIPFVRHPSRDGLLRCRENFDIDASEDSGDREREREQSGGVRSFAQEYFHYGHDNMRHGSDRSSSPSAEGSWSLLYMLNKPATKLLWISILFLVIIFLNLAKCVGSETLYWGINGAMLASVTLSTTLAGLLLHITWKKGTGSGTGTGTAAGIECRPDTKYWTLLSSPSHLLYQPHVALLILRHSLEPSRYHEAHVT